MLDCSPRFAKRESSLDGARLLLRPGLRPRGNARSHCALALISSVGLGLWRVHKMQAQLEEAIREAAIRPVLLHLRA
jgi:hypothetical protein